MEKYHTVTSSAPELTLALTRNLLASIDLSDIDPVDEETPLSEVEAKNYNAAIFAVFPRLEKDIKKLMHTQLLFASNQAENWEQVLVSRGTFNGLSLLLEKWKAANAAHIENSKVDWL